MDIEHIRNLVELMVSNDLSRIEIHEGETHILLRRGQPLIAGAAPALPAPMMLSTPTSTPATTAAPAASATAAGAAAAETAAGERETLVRSPMVGTFYASPDPDSPPFVSVGTLVGPDTIVCLVEAMKVFNEIKAEVSGRITRVLAKNAQAVEFDQPLFAVTPA